MFKEEEELDPVDREQLNRYSDSAIDLIKLASLNNEEVMRSTGVETYKVKDSEDKVGVIKMVIGMVRTLFGGTS